jgi:hypothetical protein
MSGITMPVSYWRANAQAFANAHFLVLMILVDIYCPITPAYPNVPVVSEPLVYSSPQSRQPGTPHLKLHTPDHYQSTPCVTLACVLPLTL